MAEAKVSVKSNELEALALGVQEEVSVNDELLRTVEDMFEYLKKKESGNQEQWFNLAGKLIPLTRRLNNNSKKLADILKEIVERAK